MAKWELNARWNRRITSAISKTGCERHACNFPNEIYKALCNEFGGDCENTIQLLMLKNDDGNHMIVLASFDGLEQLLANLNKE